MSGGLDHSGEKTELFQAIGSQVRDFCRRIFPSSWLFRPHAVDSFCRQPIWNSQAHKEGAFALFSFQKGRYLLDKPAGSTNPHSINLDGTTKWNSQNKPVHVTSKFRRWLDGSDMKHSYTFTSFQCCSQKFSDRRLSKGCESNFPLWHIRNCHERHWKLFHR